MYQQNSLSSVNTVTERKWNEEYLIHKSKQKINYYNENIKGNVHNLYFKNKTLLRDIKK